MSISLPKCSHCHQLTSTTYDFHIRSSFNKIDSDGNIRPEITDKLNHSGLCINCLLKYLHHTESVVRSNPTRVQLLQEPDPVMLELDLIVPDDDLPF